MLPSGVLAAVAEDGSIGGLSLAWLAFVIGASAIAMVACGVMSARRTLHPNVLVGIRTSFTLDGDRNWYAVHDRAAPVFTGSGLLYALSIVPLFLLDGVGPQATGLLILIGVGTVVLCVGTIRAQRAAKAALAEEDAREAGGWGPEEGASDPGFPEEGAPGDGSSGGGADR
ncbi:SdpI family protein [Nocardiopsis coralli]|uniref:SdpI family protein n=1 Tax=Nocardiopsis coralli TaxID=2772213 RepID=UPI001C0FA19C|nr:SdpI family protein [Nocardiopsis coralli]